MKTLRYGELHGVDADRFTLVRARILAQEVKRWTNEASIQGGVKEKAHQLQLHALDLVHRAQQELIELLNDTRGEKSPVSGPSEQRGTC